MATLNFTVLAENGLVVGYGAMRQMLGELIRRALMGDFIAYAMRFPSIIQGLEMGRIHSPKLFPGFARLPDGHPRSP